MNRSTRRIAPGRASGRRFPYLGGRPEECRPLRSVRSKDYIEPQVTQRTRRRFQFAPSFAFAGRGRKNLSALPMKSSIWRRRDPIWEYPRLPKVVSFGGSMAIQLPRPRVRILHRREKATRQQDAFSIERIVPTKARPSEAFLHHSVAASRVSRPDHFYCSFGFFYWPCCANAIHALKPYHSPYVRHRPKFITDNHALFRFNWRLAHASINHVGGYT